jgi:alcohol dehydrogenase class IV
MWEFTTPRTIVFGENALDYLKEVEGKRALIVTDKVINKLGSVDKVAKYLKEAGMKVEVFDEVEPEPSVETIIKGAELAKKYGPDWFVGLGGGSCMDAAKAIWVLYERPDMEVGAINPLQKLGLRKKARLICIPTTSGTGAEATWAVIITDAKENRKMELGSRENVADIAILDPELPKSMPSKLAADTGLDALTHAIESYTNQCKNDFSDAVAIKATQIIFKYLPRACRNPEDKEAKEKMHNAAAMAGLAFINSAPCPGAAHGMGHSFGAIFHIPHGRAVSVFLPCVIQYNAREALERYAEIAEAIGIEAKMDEDAVDKLVEAVKRLMKEVGSPIAIKDMGIGWKEYEKNLDGLVDKAANSSCISMNARALDAENIKRLFIHVYEGKKVDF